jgi:hypothetical protein
VTVAHPSIEESLENAEARVAAGEGLGGTGFWPAVSEVKASPELVERFADRIAAIDRAAHSDWALITVPLWLGTTIMIAGLLGGLALIGWAYYLDDLAAILVFGLGVLALLGTTHGLAHLAVGWGFGMRFSSWFIGKVSQPQPGVKIDYSTYLRTSPRKRAWMHASGAIATKLVPFVLVPAAIAADLPTWVTWVLLAAGVGQIITDISWSTRSSDWKKFRREMGFAQES